jgi:hypothetical protein
MANCKQRKTSQLHRKYPKYLLNASGEVAVSAPNGNCNRVASLIKVSMLTYIHFRNIPFKLRNPFAVGRNEKLQCKGGTQKVPLFQIISIFP